MTTEHTPSQYDKAIDRYISSLSEIGAKQALAFVLRDERTREFVINCALEYDRAFPRTW
jgi:hypothetical protein